MPILFPIFVQIATDQLSFSDRSSNFQSHKLFSAITLISFSLSGRGKIKKMILPLVAAAGVKIFALVPILIGGLALLALKALFFGKIALLIAGIMAFQKLFGGGGGVGTGGIFGKNPQINGWYDNGAASGWSAGSSVGVQPQGYYRRSLDDDARAKADAHNLAYSAHAPAASDSD